MKQQLITVSLPKFKIFNNLFVNLSDLVFYGVYLKRPNDLHINLSYLLMCEFVSLMNRLKVYMVINPGTQTGNCQIGLSADGSTWKYLTKIAPAGGFLRGTKYVVSVDAADPIDGDGNSYNTVLIGTQTWMAENLKTTKYNDGTAIPNVTVAGTWSTGTTGAYCDYNNVPSNSAIYGRLYNWYAIDNTSKKAHKKTG